MDSLFLFGKHNLQTHCHISQLSFEIIAKAKKEHIIALISNDVRTRSRKTSDQ